MGIRKVLAERQEGNLGVQLYDEGYGPHLTVTTNGYQWFGFGAPMEIQEMILEVLSEHKERDGAE